MTNEIFVNSPFLSCHSTDLLKRNILIQRQAYSCTRKVDGGTYNHIKG